MAPVTRGNPEESEESHAECSEVSVFPQALAGILLLLTAETAEHLHAQGGEDEEQQEEEEAEVPHLRQSLHHCVQQSSDPLRHLEELEDPGDPQDPHHTNQGRVDDEGLQCNLSVLEDI